MRRSQVFRSCDDFFGLFSHCDMDNIGFAAFAMDNSNSAMITSVWHAFVCGGLDQNCNFLSFFVWSENSTQTNFPSLSRFLSKK